MSIQQHTPAHSHERQRSLRRLSQLFAKIEYLQLPQKDFSTGDLSQLSILAEYSIHPAFSSKEMHQFYLKLSNKYWENHEKLNLLNRTSTVPITESIIETDAFSDVKSTKSTQNHQLPNCVQENTLNQQNLQTIDQNVPTEATDQEIKQIELQCKVSKSYNDIKKFFLQFDYDDILQKQKIKPKIQLLNAWTPVSCQLQNFTQKKVIETPNKIDSATYLQNIKLGKLNRKDSTNQQISRTIILGKNESTETKQMKHMLKVQAKTNFVDEKQKEESQLNTLQKKSIELNYLLNVITKEYFMEFFADILKIVKQTGGTMEILCQKIIQKVKQEHNFIQVYVQLIKKLCKSSIPQISNQFQSKKFNQFHQCFVVNLQQSFIKQISASPEASSSNFNEYKYQKQMVGMCKFIGVLIKEKVLSKRIFKVCFWQIVYRYVEKVNQNPQNEIINESLIEGIILISQSMGNTELLKMIENQTNKTWESDLTIEINKYGEMMAALVNPCDQDQVKRQKLYKDLIQSVKINEYPHILKGLIQIHVSKRMKLKFLVENWHQKIQNLLRSPLQDIQKLDYKKYRTQQQVEMIEQKIEEDLLQIDHELKLFIQFIKEDANINSLSQKHNKKSEDLIKSESLIKKFIASVDTQQDLRKVFKLLAIEFLKEFADCKDSNLVEKRIRYFVGFIDSMALEGLNNLLLDIMCEEELQSLMIIECDYPFLVEGICLLFVELMGKVEISCEQLLKKIRKGFDPEDEDMSEFYDKVELNLKRLGQKVKSD